MGEYGNICVAPSELMRRQETEWISDTSGGGSNIQLQHTSEVRPGHFNSAEDAGFDLVLELVQGAMSLAQSGTILRFRPITKGVAN